jgi:hypothetical protein
METVRSKCWKGGLRNRHNSQGTTVKRVVSQKVDFRYFFG